MVRAKSRRSRLWVLVVLVLFLLMGYATEGPLQLPEWDPEEAGDGLAWSNILVWIFIGLALLAYVGFLWIILTSPIYEDEDEKYEDPKRLPWQVVAFLGVMFAGFAALIAWLRKNAPEESVPPQGPPGVGPGFPGGLPGGRGGYLEEMVPGEMVSHQVPAILLWILGIMAGLMLAAVVFRIIKSRPAPKPVEGPTHEEQRQALQQTIAVSLAQLEAEPDPRKAILACYRGFLHLMQEQGLQLPASYTAEESLYAALANFDLPEGALQTLIDIFQLARFSRHPMTVEDKAQAIGALKECKAALEQAEAEEESRAKEEQDGYNT
ncbi:MAG: DUF4129 domain-containing protein [Firmicutes bacterium]|nr:DUF4129 domain-containing protein [Bacillota bacterium]